MGQNQLPIKEQNRKDDDLITFFESAAVLCLSLLPQIFPHTQCVCVCVSDRGPSPRQPRRERDAHYGATSKTAEEHFRRGRKEQVFWGCRTHHYGEIFKGTIHKDIMTNYRLWVLENGLLLYSIILFNASLTLTKKSLTCTTPQMTRSSAFQYAHSLSLARSSHWFLKKIESKAACSTFSHGHFFRKEWVTG